MKILAGDWGGRAIAQPKTSATRPLSDKLRAACFDILGPVDGLTVLDAYAGSGAFGLEALSRGGLLVEAIESNPQVARTIEANALSLEAGMRFLLHRMTVETWLASPAQQPPTPRYDIILADPPYQKLEEDILDRLINYLNPEGVLMVSHSSKRPAPVLESGESMRQKDYGDSALAIYRRR